MPPEHHTGDLRSAPEARPLLTIAIPTFNRAAQLAELLEVLCPEVAGRPQVEVFVSDNASTDATPAVVGAACRGFAAAGARLRTHRHPENLGADANFVSCYRAAAGTFFWICGDDDRIVPGAIAEVLALLQTTDGAPAPLDLVYATSYGYRSDFRAERTGDPLGRCVHIVPNARTFARVVNIMFTFISGMIINKDRLEALPHEPPEAFLGTNLVQLSWTLPLLRQHRRSAVLWTRPVAARVGNAHGYSLGKVFGRQLGTLVPRLLPGRPDLARPILNMALRRWFPSILVESRTLGQIAQREVLAPPTSADSLQLHEAQTELQQAFGRNPRFWLFVYPALRLPLGFARPYVRATALLNKLLYALQLPTFWRKST